VPGATGTPTTNYTPVPLQPGTSTTGAGTGTPASAVRVHRSSSSSISGGAIALAALAALLALGALAWGIARWLAYEPRWTVSLRHAMAEAGFRASATWAEFTDWARLGR
jgi:hypothetical protein